MVKETNIISRVGSKQNDIQYFKNYLVNDKSTIVEVFGGGYSIIKHYYKDYELFNFHINDDDKNLFYIYNNSQEMINIYLKLVEIYKSEYELNKDYKAFKLFFENYIMHDSIKNYIRNRYFIRGNMFTYNKSQVYNKNELLILQNSKITNLDYMKIFEMYKDNENSFLILDPPYLFSNNSKYQSQIDNTDSTQILIDILYFIKSCKCKVLLIINKLKIIEWMFQDYIKSEYSRTYQISKRKEIHLIITNY
jgi:hypothetical protein